MCKQIFTTRIIQFVCTHPCSYEITSFQKIIILCLIGADSYLLLKSSHGSICCWRAMSPNMTPPPPPYLHVAKLQFSMSLWILNIFSSITFKVIVSFEVCLKFSLPIHNGKMWHIQLNPAVVSPDVVPISNIIHKIIFFPARFIKKWIFPISCIFLVRVLHQMLIDRASHISVIKMCNSTNRLILWIMYKDEIFQVIQNIHVCEFVMCNDEMVVIGLVLRRGIQILQHWKNS